MEIAIQELPQLPEVWDYDVSVNSQNERRDIITKWYQVTVDFLNELYIAREKLSSQGARTDLTSTQMRQSWPQYCEDIGLTKSTANRWIKKHFKPLEIQETSEVVTIIPDGEFNVIYADPPWAYSNSGFDMSAAKQYPTMATEDICEMDIESIVSENAICFMWVTNPLLEDGIDVMNSWGFEYKTNMVWIKDRHTAGFYVFGQHELLLIGVRGSMLPSGEKYKSIITGENSIHSKKPDSVRTMIEKMYPGQKYLELFARQKSENWEVFGNEI